MKPAAVRSLLENPYAVRIGRLVGALVVVWLIAAPYLVSAYTIVLLSRTAALGVLAVSVAVLTGKAGLPTLGQVAPFAVGAYATGILSEHGTSIGVVHLLVAAGAAAAFSAIVGPIVVRTRGVTVLMITLAVGELTRTAAEQWKSVTHGTDGLTAVPPIEPVPGMGPITDDVGTYWYVLTVGAIVLTITALVLRSPLGLLLDGCRENETRMRASGHFVTRYLLVTYVATGALAGVGGAMLVSVQRYVSPADAGFDTSSLVLLAVVIGGGASIVGALCGATLIVFTRDWLAGPWPGHGPLLLGGLFIVAVYALPKGLAGLAPTTRRASAPSPAPTFEVGEQPRDEGDLLVVSGLTRRYGALTAVEGFDLAVRSGARHALLGPNGAGKTTALAMVAGSVRPTAGTVCFAGQDVTGSPIGLRARLGIARAFQQPTVIGSLTVRENVALAAWRHTDVRQRWRPSRFRRLTAEVTTHLETVGLGEAADRPAGGLSHGERRLLDIAAALAGHPRLLLLDEPAAGLTDADVGRLTTLLVSLPRTITLVFVEHNMAVVDAVADTVTVLSAGRFLATGTPAEVAENAAVREVYLGTTPAKAV